MKTSILCVFCTYESMRYIATAQLVYKQKIEIKLDLMIFMDPFQLRLFYNSMKS